MNRNKKRRPIGFRWMAYLLAWLVVAWAIAVFVLVRVLGDRWWVATLAMFSPRWLLLAPLGLGILAWIWVGRWTRWTLFVSVTVTTMFVSGFCLPWRVSLRRPLASYRILTCNVAGRAGEFDQLERLIADVDADILMLQEYRGDPGIDLPDSWSTYRKGNLLIASRFPLRNEELVTRELPGRWPRPVGIAAEAVTPARVLPLATVHLLSPRKGLSQIVDRQLIVDPDRKHLLIDSTIRRESESARVVEFVDGLSESIVVAGDFNMPVESYFFRHHWDSFRDAFSEAGFGIGNSCFVNQGGIIFGARIDHVLTRGQWKTIRCWMGPDIGSDHLPLIADVYWED